MYYKAKLNNEIVDALDELQCVYYSPKVKRVLRCGEKETPQGIISSGGDNIWLVDGWEKPSEATGYNTITLTEIGQEEYQAIRSALDNNYDPPDVEEGDEEPPEDQDTVEWLRDQTVRAMSRASNAAIVAGFFVTLSDGQEHHFSLETYDQIMISRLADKAARGETALPWHEDDGECKFYPPEDILTLNAQMEQLITYHNTYFNSLKCYILSMKTMQQISSVQYGMRIPEEYWSEVLTALYSEMGATT